jgi:hypothetical protein
MSNTVIERDVVVYPFSTHPMQLSTLNCNLDTSVYPLLFPMGDFGFSPGFLQHGGITQISINQFYRYRLFTRSGHLSHPHYGRRLFQQFVVDVFARIEAAQLFYHSQFLNCRQDTVRVCFQWVFYTILCLRLHH